MGSTASDIGLVCQSYGTLSLLTLTHEVLILLVTLSIEVLGNMTSTKSMYCQVAEVNDTLSKERSKNVNFQTIQ